MKAAAFGTELQQTFVTDAIGCGVASHCSVKNKRLISCKHGSFWYGNELIAVTVLKR